MLHEDVLARADKGPIPNLINKINNKIPYNQLIETCGEDFRVLFILGTPKNKLERRKYDL